MLKIPFLVLLLAAATAANTIWKYNGESNARFHPIPRHLRWMDMDRNGWLDRTELRLGGQSRSFSKADKNHWPEGLPPDAFLTKKEIRKLMKIRKVENFSKYDKNGDNKLGYEEWKQYWCGEIWRASEGEIKKAFDAVDKYFCTWYGGFAREKSGWGPGPLGSWTPFDDDIVIKSWKEGAPGERR